MDARGHRRKSWGGAWKPSSSARRSRSARELHLRPLALTFPDPDHHREGDPLAELAREQLADVLHRREFQHVVPIAVVVAMQDLAGADLEVVEVHDDALARGILPLDDDLDLVGVAVHLPALRVAGQEMGAVDELGYAQFQASDPRKKPTTKRRGW